ncbi:transcription termination/antitermination protein NusG [Bacteriovoracaceae bacterium]|nr:transcription termination/antitermination protein NusG [Bacteriovoracaceae bacterium]
MGEENMNDEKVEAVEQTETEVEATEVTPESVEVEAEVEAPATNSDGTERDPALAFGTGPDFKWYIAKTLTGQENKVAKTLRERIVNLKKTEFFSEILIPEETVVSNAGGKKRTLKKKFFPGYILLRMVMSNDTWHLVKDTEKITGFVGGTPDKPAAITEDEAKYMLGQVEDGIKKPKTSVDFEEGEQVKVIEGPFASFVGTIEAVNDKGKVRVNVSIFGRPTPVELDFTQIERVS